jgi:hypothetical protein
MRRGCSMWWRRSVCGGPLRRRGALWRLPVRCRLSMRCRLAMRRGCRGLCDRLQLQLLHIVGVLHIQLLESHTSNCS